MAVTRYNNEAREARSAKPFFSWFSKEQIASSQRVMRGVYGVFFIFSVCVCFVPGSMFVSVNIAIVHLGQTRSTHTAPTPVPMGSVHAQIITKPSRAGLAVSCSELVELGAATCVFRGMAGPCLKSLEHTYQVQVPV